MWQNLNLGLSSVLVKSKWICSIICAVTIFSLKLLNIIYSWNRSVFFSSSSLFLSFLFKLIFFIFRCPISCVFRYFLLELLLDIVFFDCDYFLVFFVSFVFLFAVWGGSLDVLEFLEVWQRFSYYIHFFFCGSFQKHLNVGAGLVLIIFRFLWNLNIWFDGIRNERYVMVFTFIHIFLNYL